MIELLGTITATTTAKNQTDTAASFTIEPGARIVIQSDLACYVKLVAASGTAATVAGALQVEAYEKFEFSTGTRLQYLSVITSAGTANVKVFRVYTN